MIGSEIVSQVISDQLPLIPEVVTTVHTRIRNGMRLPQQMALPACLFYPEFSHYPQEAIGSVSITGEEMRYVIAFICKGASTNSIVAATKAQLDHFKDLTVDVEIDGIWGQVSFRANGEVLPVDISDGATDYRRLGTVYLVDINKGA